MLSTDAMSRTAALALVMVAAAASTASAGAYIGLGIGTSARASSDDTMMEGEGRSGRLLIGYGIGRLGIEGSGTRYDVWVAGAPMEATQLALGLRYGLPIGNNFGLFGRGGLQRTSLNTMGGGYDADGSGLYLGLGVDYKLPIAAVGASLFMDYQRSWTTFDNGYGEYGGVAGIWTLGATLSF
jgi:hypothetical protein